jgi:hypothetical protein
MTHSEYLGEYIPPFLARRAPQSCALNDVLNALLYLRFDI